MKTHDRPLTFKRHAGSCALGLAVLALGPNAWAASDGWLTTKSKVELLTTEGVGGLDIHVDTRDGLVTLHGPVATTEEKAKAERSVRAVDGVRDVRNLLQVVPARTSEAVEVTDDALKQRVKDALDADPALEGIGIESVTDGYVVLGGDARSLAAHERALRAVRGLDGVVSVASTITSPDAAGDRELRDPPSREDETPGEAMRSAASDAWITGKVKLALVAADDVNALDVNVDTRGGQVVLFGTVPSEVGRANAARRAAEIEGVAGVENELQVVVPSTREAVGEGDAAIRSSIASRLDERSDLAGADVTVEVAEGVVRLTGTIAEETDRLAVIDVARATPGVRKVIDDLRATEGGA